MRGWSARAECERASRRREMTSPPPSPPTQGRICTERSRTTHSTLEIRKGEKVAANLCGIVYDNSYVLLLFVVTVALDL